MAGLFVFTRLIGKKHAGKVVGAVEEVRTKTKTRDGKKVEETKVTLYPVYEYTLADGAIRHERGSEGGTMTYKYKTGQDVNLLIIEADGYDDVYDADSFGALVIGLVIMAAGGGIMVQVGSIYSALGMGVVSVAAAIGVMLFRAFAEHRRTSRRAGGAAKKTRAPYKKTFDPNAVRPVEEFINKRNREKAETPDQG